jgi:hypothetical protein
VIVRALACTAVTPIQSNMPFRALSQPDSVPHDVAPQREANSGDRSLQALRLRMRSP